MSHYFLLFDGDDDYHCDSIEELQDLIADIADHRPKDEDIILTVEIKAVRGEDGE